MLYEFVAANRDRIVRRCREKVVARSVPAPTEAELDRAVPLLLDQLIGALRGAGLAGLEGADGTVRHGQDLLHQGFTVSQVVRDYGDVCQAITELAGEANAPLSAENLRVLNGCLDDAIASAVTGCARADHQRATDDADAHEAERLGFFVHELRNLISTAIVSFDTLKSASVGVAGGAGTVLYRSLMGVRDLVSRSLAEMRLTKGVQHPEQFLVSDLLDELMPAATLAADAGGVTLAVMPVEAGVAIEADRQVVAAVLMNLLQNALKFTRPRTIVTLRVRASAERVLLDIQDECGGLPDGDVTELFRPYTQRSANRTGLGLGLAFCQWGAEANHGRIHARSIPASGCIFTVDLPRVSAVASATDGAAMAARALSEGEAERRVNPRSRAS